MIQFSPFDVYFDKTGKPTALGQQLFLRLNQLFAAQDASIAGNSASLSGVANNLAETQAGLVQTQADLTETQADVTTTQGDVTALTAVVATKAPMASPVFSGVPVLPSYTVAGVPAPTAGGLVYASNESGGAVVAFSDGTNWRRVTDRAVIS